MNNPKDCISNMMARARVAQKKIEFATQTKADDICARLARTATLANSGAWTNSMPTTQTLDCGMWGNNSVSENVTYKHLLNTTWISWPIPSTEPKLEELFSNEEWD